MNKRKAIAIVNGHLGHRLLDHRNTNLSSVNASKPVWWLNIKSERFDRELHILLAKENDGGLVWLRIEQCSIPSIDRIFRVRKDKGAVDLEISSNPGEYLTDVKSGGTRYNFAKHIEREWAQT